jgi:hypothetical protein
MRRTAVIVATLLATYLGWRFAMLYMDTKPEQDECAFGRVSSQEYKALRAEATTRSRLVWSGLTGTEIDQADNFRNRIADINAGKVSLHERIAGMHAVMRSAGAFFHGMRPYNKDIKLTGEAEDPLNGVGGIGFPYFIDSIRLGSFDLVDRYARITIDLPLVVTPSDFNRNDVKRPIKFDEFYATISYPDSLSRFVGFGGKGRVGYDPNTKGFSCPPVPPANWINVYEQWKTIQEKRDAK